MFTDAESNEDKSTSLLADVTDDSSRLEYIEIAPLTRDTDGPCTTDCETEDWSAQVKQENLTVVKQEPQGVCTVILSYDRSLQFALVITDILT